MIRLIQELFGQTLRGSDSSLSLVSRCSWDDPLLIRNSASFQSRIFPMTNDTAVFDAVRLNIRTGSEVWTGRRGTPEAIRRDGLLIGGELRYCPHEWLDKRGSVDPELAQEHPNSRSL